MPTFLQRQQRRRYRGTLTCTPLVEAAVPREATLFGGPKRPGSRAPCRIVYPTPRGVALLSNANHAHAFLIEGRGP